MAPIFIRAGLKFRNKKCRFEIQEQKEVSMWYAGIYRPISSARANVENRKLQV
jgi:hypothetical protein